MFENPQIFLFLCVASAALYWCIPGRWFVARALFLCVVSGLAIYIASPPALLLCLIASTIVALASPHMHKLKSNIHMYGILFVFFVTFLILRHFLKIEGALITLGMAFYFLKSAAMLADSFKLKDGGVSPISIFTMNMFFPIYAAGPLSQWDNFTRKSMNVEFNYRFMLNGFFRIFIGIFKTTFLMGTVLHGFIANQFGDSPFEPGGANTIEVIGFVLLNWLSLYIGFSGYTDMAIGASLLFGIRAPENFKFPFLARSIQEYWQRWHLSLVAITNRYIFRPLVRNTGKVYYGIFGTFIFMGMWHELTFQYLVWGVVHAIAMYTVYHFMRYKNSNPKLQAFLDAPPFRVLGVVMTLTFVGFLSSFANSGSFEKSIALAQNMFGLS